jgi:integrase
MSERGVPFTTAGWRKMVARLGVAAKLGFKAHPHMFRHACGFQLANQSTDTRTLHVRYAIDFAGEIRLLSLVCRAAIVAHV